MLDGRSGDASLDGRRDDASDPILGSPEVEEAPLPTVLPPPDPIEQGTCALSVRLRGSPTGNSEKPHDSVAGRVDLWRIDAPPNDGWARGDQLQGHVNVGMAKGVAQFDKLPSGFYRIHAYGQRRGSEDPEPFEVHGAETVVEFEVATPRSYPVHVRVFDEYGSEIRIATAKKGSAGGSIRHVGRPGWVRERKVTDPNVNATIGLGGGGWGEYSRRGPYPLGWSEQGFPLGRFLEETRSRTRRDTRQLQWQDRTSVSVHVTGKIRKATTYVCVSVPLESIRACIFLPDGRRADDAGAAISARCDAQPMGDDFGPRDYAELEIRVSVSLAGFKDLKFTYTLDSDTWTKTLVPSEKN